MRYLPQLSKRQWTLVGIVGLLVVLATLLFSGLIPGLIREEVEEVELTMAGIDDRRIWRPIIRAYQERFPNVDIEYQQLNPEDYENALLNRLATDGPDIFMAHNTWLPKHFEKMMPASQSQFSVSRFQSLFPTAAVQDFAPDSVVFGLPLYIDTLALYYNKEDFDEAGVAVPPRTWLEFQNLVADLPFPAAAIGGSAANISTAPDILNLLFLQAGAPMVDGLFSRATFPSSAQSAFDFYLKFTNPESDFYTWNSEQPPAEQLFARGELPMIFQYNSFAERLRQVNPFLNFAVAPIPQPVGAGPSVAYPSYYGLAVSNKSTSPATAWDFIEFATTDDNIAGLYVQAVGQKPALRRLLDDSVFGRQALTARSWPQIDSREVRRIFSEMIESVLQGRLDSRQALRAAEQEITALMRRR